jgi:hypothetical protein
MEQLNQARPLCRRKFFAAQPAGGGNGTANLLDILVAWGAQSNMLLELRRFGGGEHTFKVVRNNLDELFARQIIRW